MEFPCDLGIYAGYGVCSRCAPDTDTAKRLAHAHVLAIEEKDSPVGRASAELLADARDLRRQVVDA